MTTVQLKVNSPKNEANASLFALLNLRLVAVIREPSGIVSVFRIKELYTVIIRMSIVYFEKTKKSHRAV